MSSDTTDFHPGYLHPDTLEIMQDDNRLASQLGRHHDHHAASQRHREALSEHSPAVTPVLTPRAVLSSAMLPLRQERRLGREDASGGSGWAVGLVLADRGFIRQIIADTPADRATLVRESAPGVWQGECRVGDQIIEVNKKEVMYLDSKDIAAVLRFETQKRVSLELGIKRQQHERNAIVGAAKNHGEFTVPKFPLSDLQCTLL